MVIAVIGMIESNKMGPSDTGSGRSHSRRGVRVTCYESGDGVSPPTIYVLLDRSSASAALQPLPRFSLSGEHCRRGIGLVVLPVPGRDHGSSS